MGDKGVADMAIELRGVVKSEQNDGTSEYAESAEKFMDVLLLDTEKGEARSG
jgi:hypothetical protein